jgi:sulfide:quinone oxidoreductase
MSLKIVPLTETLAVAPQITAGDIADIAAKGYRTLVNNRPDNEAPGQLPSEEAERLAEAAGLRYEYFPITAPTLTADQVEAFARLLPELEGPILAYCRSGSRCSLLWAATELLKGRTSADVLIRKVAERGFDIASLTRFA